MLYIWGFYVIKIAVKFMKNGMKINPLENNMDQPMR